MNPEHDHEPHETAGRAEPVEPMAAAELINTPDAIRARGLRTTSQRGLSAGRWSGRGVEWVRPSDLLARHGAAWAGRGIDFEVELARRTRRTALTGSQTMAERARRLPPLSAFGQRHRQVQNPGRTAVGSS